MSRGLSLSFGLLKCRLCPLYDPEWAAESGEQPRFVLPFLDPEAEETQIPDHLPDEWGEG